MSMPARRLLVGRTIVDYDPRPWRDQSGNLAHDPRIVLDDGSILIFNTEETEAGEYGTSIHRVPAKQRRTR